uniref:MHC class I-like antigen recognition-like domain-containing protein n=1 Tax=Castor canadensis TaxID=51338 RepID=A0A8C0VW00_CASCN
MLLLLLSLLAAFILSADSEIGESSGFEASASLYITQITSSYNHSWVQSLVSVWMDEFLTHRWDSTSGSFIFLHPSPGATFSYREWSNLDKFFQANFRDQIVNTYSSRLQFEYPFVTQVAAGCELHSGKGFVGFLKIACQGSNFFSFQNKSCSPSPNGGGRAQQACSVFNQYNSYTERVHRLLSDTCLMFLWGLLEAGKAKFQRQEHPNSVGWIFLAVIMTLVVLSGLVFWSRKHPVSSFSIISSLSLQEEKQFYLLLFSYSSRDSC